MTATEQTYATAAAVLFALLVGLGIFLLVEHLRDKVNRERRTDIARAMAVVQRTCAPHKPIAIMHEGQRGWIAGCDHDDCLDRPWRARHDDPWDALDEACGLIRESVHGPNE